MVTCFHMVYGSRLQQILYSIDSWKIASLHVHELNEKWIISPPGQTQLLFYCTNSCGKL